jgi:uncharacterized protein (DUF427 family)
VVRRPKPEVPGPGQESAWDYPRPPRLERTASRIVIVLGGVTVADTTEAYRVLETSHPPVYYLPPEAFRPGTLKVSRYRGSYCEFKGVANYLAVSAGGRVEANAAWSYPEPLPGFEPIAGYVAVYADRMDRCTVDGEEVTPQPGGFYGGWITSTVVGPFKGGPGSLGW